MSFALGGAAPLASVLGGSSPLSPSISGVALLTPVLKTDAQAVIAAGETAAMPPPDVVYEPGAQQDGASLTYSPPAAMPMARANDTDDAPAAGDNEGGASDAAISVAVAASSSVRTQFAPAPAVAETRSAAESPVSVQIARATQSIQASQSAPATMPGLASADAAPVPMGDPQTQSQVVAQAVYSLIADAYVQDRPVTDLIKFA